MNKYQSQRLLPNRKIYHNPSKNLILKFLNLNIWNYCNGLNKPPKLDKLLEYLTDYDKENFFHPKYTFIIFKYNLIY